MLDVAPGLIHESGPARKRSWAPERVAVMAHWSADAEPTRSVVATLAALEEGGYDTLLVSSADAASPVGRQCTWAPGAPGLPAGTTVLRRANVGYDFGSWAAALEAFPGVRRASRTLLLNDSVIGPLSPLEPVLDDFEACPAPVWGLVGSRQHRPHLQSFFLGFKGGVLDSASMREFWTDIRVERRKSKVVRYGELGMAEALDEAGIGWAAMVSPSGGGPGNPSLSDPAGLWESGVPFIKANAPLDPVVRDRLRSKHWLSEFTQDVSVSPLNTLQRTKLLVDVEGPWGLTRRGRERLRGSMARPERRPSEAAEPDTLAADHD